MIHASVSIFTRTVEGHTERVHRTTWWLLGIIPIYISDYIISHNR